MAKELEQENVNSRLAAIMLAYNEENGNSVMNLGSVARLLEEGAYKIEFTGNLKEHSRRSEEETAVSIAKSIKRLCAHVNRLSDIAFKGTEKADLDVVIADNMRHTKALHDILSGDAPTEEELAPNKAIKFTSIKAPMYKVGNVILNEYEVRMLQLEVAKGEKPVGLVVTDQEGTEVTILEDGRLSGPVFGFDISDKISYNLYRMKLEIKS
jgi:hypothetical protein